jgi:hypothetical protein
VEENKRLELMLRNQDKIFLVNNLIPLNTYEYKYNEHGHEFQLDYVEFGKCDSQNTGGSEISFKKCCSRCNSELPSPKSVVSSSEDIVTN